MPFASMNYNTLFLNSVVHNSPSFSKLISFFSANIVYKTISNISYTQCSVLLKGCLAVFLKLYMYVYLGLFNSMARMMLCLHRKHDMHVQHIYQHKKIHSYFNQSICLQPNIPPIFLRLGA